MNVATILAMKGREVATISAETSVAEIADALTTRRIGALVVVGSGGGIEGIVSERDLVKAMAASRGGALALCARDVMTRTVETCSESDTLDRLMNHMTRRRIRHLPVVQDGRMIGIVSIGDVVKNHIAEVEQEASYMRDYIATH